MSKIEELEKRKERVETDLKKAQERLEKQQEAVTRKENELKQIEAELFSALLIENNLTLDELKSLLADKQTTIVQTTTGESQTGNLGGNEHV